MTNEKELLHRSFLLTPVVRGYSRISPLWIKKLITFSKLRYEISHNGKMKYCIGLYELHLSNVNNFDTVMSTRWPIKREPTKWDEKNQLFIAISFWLRWFLGVRVTWNTKSAQIWSYLATLNLRCGWAALTSEKRVQNFIFHFLISKYWFWWINNRPLRIRLRWFDLPY